MSMIVPPNWCINANAIIARTKDLIEICQIHDQCVSIRQHLKRTHALLTAQNNATAIALRAARKGGLMLQSLLQRGGRKESRQDTLKSLDISKSQSSRWQLLASIPENDFDEYISSRISNGQELTTADILKRARDCRRFDKRRAREDEALRVASESEDSGIIEGDISALASDLKDSSVDFILTDPPYADMDAYERLAQLFATKLRKGGLCAVYAGINYMPEVYSRMGKHLKYFWTIAMGMPGSNMQNHSRLVRNLWKPIIVFARPPITPNRDWLLDALVGEGRRKTFHEWQQPENEVEYLINTLTDPGNLVVDPFAGSGTTLSVAKRLGRRWRGSEINPRTAAVAKKRIADTPDAHA